MKLETFFEKFDQFADAPMRRFFFEYRSRIGQTPSDQLTQLLTNGQTNIHAKEYQLYLPSKELLQAKLLEWTRREETRRR